MPASARFMLSHLGTVLVGSLVLGFLAGCESGARRYSLDKDLARESLVSCLEAWKQGDSPAALKDRSPTIVVRDPDWESKRRLVSYRWMDGETNDGTNLHATIELVFDGPSRRQKPQPIIYVVGTSPTITVFRK